MQVIHLQAEISLIPNQVLPEAVLPQGAALLGGAAVGQVSRTNAFRSAGAGDVAFDQAPAVGKIRVAFWQPCRAGATRAVTHHLTNIKALPHRRGFVFSARKCLDHGIAAGRARRVALALHLNQLQRCHHSPRPPNRPDIRLVARNGKTKPCRAGETRAVTHHLTDTKTLPSPAGFCFFGLRSTRQRHSRRTRSAGFSRPTAYSTSATPSPTSPAQSAGYTPCRTQRWNEDHGQSATDRTSPCFTGLACR